MFTDIFFASDNYKKIYQSKNIESNEIVFKENHKLIYLKYYIRKKIFFYFFEFNIFESFHDIIIEGNVNKKDFDIFFLKLKKICKYKKVFSIRIKNISKLNYSLIKDNIDKENFNKEIWSSNIINLTNSVDYIKKNLNATTRNVIKDKENLFEFKICKKNSDFKRFYLSYIKSSGNSEKFEKICSIDEFFTKYNNSNINLFYLNDKMTGEIYSTIVCGFDKKVSYLLKSGKNNSFPKNSAIEILLWKILLFYKDKKINFFDFNGFNPYPQNKKEKGIRFSKIKWGGEIYEFYNLKKNIYL